jgi:hypothetical protein
MAEAAHTAGSAGGWIRAPVVLILFKRPETTARVFEAIRQARPERLLLVADGPRLHRPDDGPLVAAARQVVEHVDWPCEVVRDYASDNLGAGRRVASGVDHAFRLFDRAIILEDDTLPDPSFFPFCDLMLERYADDERVFEVDGNNLLLKWQAERQSFHFSAVGSNWGWATWRRAWAHMDFELKSFEDPVARAAVRATLGDDDLYRFRLDTCQDQLAGRVNAWDYQWLWSRLARGGLAAVSAVNLISNIGFGSAATHTVHRSATLASQPRFPAVLPLRAPAEVVADAGFDRACLQYLTEIPELEAVLRQARACLEVGQPVRALLLLDGCIGAYPDRIEPVRLKAMVLERLGRKEQARALTGAST